MPSSSFISVGVPSNRLVVSHFPSFGTADGVIHVAIQPEAMATSAPER